MITNKQFKEVMSALVELISEGGFRNNYTRDLAADCNEKIAAIPDNEGGFNPNETIAGGISNNVTERK